MASRNGVPCFIRFRDGTTTTITKAQHGGWSALCEIVCGIFSSIIHAYNISSLLNDMATPGRYPRKVSVDFRKLEVSSKSFRFCTQGTNIGLQLLTLTGKLKESIRPYET